MKLCTCEHTIKKVNRSMPRTSLDHLQRSLTRGRFSLRGAFYRASQKILPLNPQIRPIRQKCSTRFQELGRREMSPGIQPNEKKLPYFQSTMFIVCFTWCYKKSRSLELHVHLRLQKSRLIKKTTPFIKTNC